jgi:transaldolase / glucose-6-phosphate isomerase
MVVCGQVAGGSMMSGPEVGEVSARQDHARLGRRDTSLWPPAAAVTGAWLGWLDGIERAPGHRAAIEAVVASLLEEGIDDVVLTGMGGSSLFPMVLREVCGRAVGHPRLHVIDSTDPAAVTRIEAAVDWSRTALVVASKSGTTVETLAHLDRFRARLQSTLAGRAVDRIVVVTDPGSPLADLAAREGFRATVLGDRDVGGRYSALSPFGLLPAALLGVDLGRLLDIAAEAVAGWDLDPWTDAGPARLAALLADGVASGRDVLHVVVPPSAAFGAWIEQLVAESSGKDGTGIIPVVVDAVADVPHDARSMVVALGAIDGLGELSEAGIPVLVTPWDGPDGLAREVMRWMQAVALACARLGVDPFDQPDVAAAKAATAAALEGGSEPDASVPLEPLLDGLSGAGYVAILAYVDPEDPVVGRLEQCARHLASRAGVPVTLGVGPRYLHSTGQLHKGGRADGVHLVIVGDDRHDIDIPGRPFGFARLKRAQAAGDLVALRAAGRRAHRIDLMDLLATSEPHAPDGEG